MIFFPQFRDCAVENTYDHRSRRVQKTVWIYDGEFYMPIYGGISETSGLSFCVFVPTTWCVTS